MRGQTHLYHLFYVLFDYRWVGIGLHRHRPLIDHGRLGVRCRSGAGVLLLRMRRKRQRCQYHRREAEAVMLQRNGSCCTDTKPRWEEWIQMPWEKKHKGIRFSTSLLSFPLNSIVWEQKRCLNHCVEHLRSTTFFCSFIKQGKRWSRYRGHPSYQDRRIQQTVGHCQKGAFWKEKSKDKKWVCSSLLVCEVLSVETSGRSLPLCGTGPETPARDRERMCH